MEHIYDMAVIGGGPGGYTAALYGARGGMDTVVLEKLAPGGQMNQTAVIDNYPGFDQGIEGFALGQRMCGGAKRFGANTVQAEVSAVELTGQVKRIHTDRGAFLTKTVVLATGAEHKHLGVDREADFVGRGVGYCAQCDGMFYKNKTVAVVGGGNCAVADALLLSRICRQVFLIHRRDTLRATKVYHRPLENAENITLCYSSTVHALLGEERLAGVEVRNVQTGQLTRLALDGLFISIGHRPVTRLFQGQVELDSLGYVVADESTCTNLPGVFAAGDVRTKPLRQIITAAADGAVAAHYAQEYLETATQKAE